MSYRTDHRADVRLARAGVSALNDTELLALVLGDGSPANMEVAKRILMAVDGIEELPRHIDALARVEQIKPDQFNRLAACAEIARRLLTPVSKRAVYVRTVQDALPYLADMAYLGQEELRVLVMDHNDAHLATRTIYRGSGTRIADMNYREIIAPAVNFNAPYMMLAHNHPSVGQNPSDPDRNFTMGFVRVAEALKITVREHIIVHPGGLTGMITGAVASFPRK